MIGFCTVNFYFFATPLEFIVIEISYCHGKPKIAAFLWVFFYFFYYEICIIWQTGMHGKKCCFIFRILYNYNLFYKLSRIIFTMINLQKPMVPSHFGADLNHAHCQIEIWNQKSSFWKFGKWWAKTTKY